MGQNKPYVSFSERQEDQKTSHGGSMDIFWSAQHIKRQNLETVLFYNATPHIVATHHTESRLTRVL